MYLITWASPRENLSLKVCEQQRRRPACAYAQSDQRLCYSLIVKYHTQFWYKRNFSSLVSLSTWAGWFESRYVGNPEDRFSRVAAQSCTCITVLSLVAGARAVAKVGSRNVHTWPASHTWVCRRTLIGIYKTMSIQSQELEARSLYHIYSLKTKSSQCHYVMTLWTFGFEAI